MKELPKAYEPQKFENEIYQRWEKSGFFNPDNLENTAGSYCNILPPPNANGELHVGHASGYTVMDIFGRYARMQGKKTLLLPGKDHAGIQTQVVFEKLLKEQENLDRQALGREKFYARTYDFCTDRANYMRSQEKKLGISADWSRERFTLDPEVLKLALETFVQMHADGLIYKGKRIINWCPRCATALSDVEVLHQEKPGKLYFIKYPLENSADFVTVATTRPETMLGDSAVAVNPKDERFAKLVGKNIVLPLQNTVIPIIADERIDLTFGTGAVKITPAHDPLDWEIGKDHRLAEIQVIDEKALITELGGAYAGLTAGEARTKILKDLQNLNLLEKTEEITHSISICERCKTIIEPLPSSQWFVNVDAPKYSLKSSAKKAIEENLIEIFPTNFKKILLDWFENMRDWCISRQIWWGPQFPVWYRTNSQLTTNSPQQEPEMYVGLTPPEGDGWIQDENTFDTWFSSGQWAHTTLQSRPADKSFYPSDMMVMGRDLLFFWSSRMIMLSLYQTGQVPFKNLFFTGLVRDKDGHKFSKSRGNGIDPLTMIEQFGADALRMSLLMDSAPGQDSRLSEEKIETFRNFANKLWNISRFCLSQENFTLQATLDPQKLKSAADHWILANLNSTIAEVTRLFEAKQIAVAADVLKTFTWDALADNYVEWHKVGKNTEVLGYVLDQTLRLWHPFMPFITEHVWSLADQKNLLLISAWPQATPDISPNKTASFSDVLSVIHYVNNVRAEYKIAAANKISLFFDEVAQGLFSAAELSFIQKRAGVAEIKHGTCAKEHLKRTLPGFNLYIPLEGLLDLKKEKLRLEKEIANLENFTTNLAARLNNAEFVAKAPATVIENQQTTLSQKKTALAEFKKQLASLN